ncbi:hypothetical protein UFOVP349_36 [uncultured Caudovirales phage]|uniref:Uncharacterized protein n=1 Tax=uncultured Caudovirales phage TaxID=2100421 RepID=A0A6J5M2W4_9CAUD|nr:hypothetical protein UFOVP349_36 [uncultured Caudovirales phage]
MASSMKIGAAWWKRDKNDQDYLSISFDPACPVIINAGQRAALFPNPNKTQQNQPDYELVILPTRQADAGEDDFNPQQAPRQASQYAAPEDFAPAPARPMAPRQAAPPPRAPQNSQAPQARAAAPQSAPRAGFRQGGGRSLNPAPSPDFDPNEFPDPFAE